VRHAWKPASAIAWACFLAPVRAGSDADLPVLRATSRTVDIEDGKRSLTGGWTIAPELPLDVYFARRAAGERRVTFRSDVDSITFDVRNGEHHDFEVLLDGKRCCLTRISTLRLPPRNTATLQASALDAVPFTIPFTIGADNKIHIIGHINDSQALDLLFDLGADTNVLFPSGIEKGVKLEFDGTVENAGSGGSVMRSMSGDNRLTVGTLRWDHEAVLFIEKQSDHADGIIGYPAFDNSVVSIDYDASVLRVGAEIPASAAHWVRLPISFRGTLPTVTAQIVTPSGEFATQLVIDTGSNATVFLDSAIADTHRLYGSMPRLGTSRMRGTGAGTIENEVMRLPALRLGSLELRELPVYVERRSEGDNSRGGHLGGEVLRRFNTVLDLRDDVAYFAPSRMRDAPYRSGYSSGRGWVVLVSVGAIALLAALVWMRRRR
jgi:hypothetical protein